MKSPLIFGKGNAKLQNIATFSLPSGYTCPFAKDCKSCANRETGKIKDFPGISFRCFSASQECLFLAVRKARWHNFEMLKKCKSKNEMADLIRVSLPKEKIVRIHVAGDFFSETYFKSWVEVAKRIPEKIFYAYTKSLPFWIKNRHLITENFRLVASVGGKHDALIEKHKLINAKVVYSEEEAKNLGLELDHDDSKAIENKKPFALIIHGVQPKGSDASKAKAELKKQGFSGYSKKKG